MQLGGPTEVDGRYGMLLKTSRSQVDGILDPKRDITLSSLQRAALVGQRVVIELI
jgi:antitoxin HicB